MGNRLTDSEKWTKIWFRELPPEYKVFWQYLCDKCDHGGVWGVDFGLASFNIGANIEEKEALKLFKDHIYIVENSNKWVLIDYVPYQQKIIPFGKKDLNPDNPFHKNAISCLTKLDLLGKLQKIWHKKKGASSGPSDAPSDGASSGPSIRVRVKDKDKDNNKDKGKDKEEDKTTPAVDNEAIDSLVESPEPVQDDPEINVAEFILKEAKKGQDAWIAKAIASGDKISENPLIERDKSGTFQEGAEKGAEGGNGTLSKSDQAKILYDLYPRKASPRSSLKAIERALDRAPFDLLKKKVTEFRAYRKSLAIGESDFTPYPASWFNGDCWLVEVENDPLPEIGNLYEKHEYYEIPMRIRQRLHSETRKINGITHFEIIAYKGGA